MQNKQPSKDWYKKIWSLDVKDMSWVEDTVNQVEFIEEILDLQGNERILDLACGFGRHSLELARRGYSVIGYDITKDYIDDANKIANEEGLNARFYLSDIRNIQCNEKFDVVLNLADGAIGYLETDEENLKIFDVISSNLKPNGKSLIDICNKAHAIKYFPKKTWEIGKKSISLPWFDFDKKTNRMLYGGFDIKIGETATLPDNLKAHSSIRLYDYEEITNIFSERKVKTISGYGSYNSLIPHDSDYLQLVIVSVKKI